MKKIIILNILAAVLMAAHAQAGEIGASAQLGAAVGWETDSIPSILPADLPMPQPEITCPEGSRPFHFGGWDFICLPVSNPDDWFPMPSVPNNYNYGEPVVAEYLRAYAAQPAAKRLVAEALVEAPSREAFVKSEAVRVTADGEAVYLAANGKVARVNDPELAAKVRKLVGKSSESQAQGGNKILFYVGAAMAIECMTDDACWGAVGDAVSAVSEWANS